jgi:hypothetical protein
LKPATFHEGFNCKGSNYKIRDKFPFSKFNLLDFVQNGSDKGKQRHGEAGVRAVPVNLSLDELFWAFFNFGVILHT